MARRVAIRIGRIRDRLNRVDNLPRICAIGSSPNVDVAAGVHEHDSSVRACIDDAVSRCSRAQPFWHGAESAGVAAVCDVVHVDDDDAPTHLVRNAWLERYSLRFR